jgi:hypothetical protein
MVDLLDDLQVRARGQGKGDGPVPQVMQPDRGQVQLCDERVEPVGEVLGPDVIGTDTGTFPEPERCDLVQARLG